MPEDDDDCGSAGGSDYGRRSAGGGQASGGRAIDASTDPSEMYFVIQTAATNTASAGGTASGVRIENTPQAVATPLPPRNRSQTG